MIEKIKDLFASLQERLQTLSTPKKLLIALSILSIIGVSSMFYYFNSRVEFALLFSELSAADAGTITQDLKEQNIAYKLTDNGRTIFVDKSQIDEYRINLAMESKLPDTASGFELFDSAGMMTTDEDRKIMYQRALTGELQRSIEALSTVKKAKVLLVIPDNNVFSDEETVPTASIVLNLKNNTISDSAVQGIVTLTAAAVENLKAEDVKVVDSAGNTLTTGAKDQNQINVINERYMSIKSEYEKDLETKINRLLAPVYGTDKFQVSVNLDLNFDSIEKTKVTYDNPEIRTETVQANGSAEDIQEAQNGTIADNVSNVTGDASDSDRSYSRTVNNELDTETTKTITAPGMINRLTSSVIVNGKLSAKAQEELKDLIASAVGYDQERGDEISIQGIGFVQADGADESDQDLLNKENVEKMKNYLKYAIIGSVILTVIAVVVFAVILIRKRKNAEEFEVDVTQEEVADYFSPEEKAIAEQLQEEIRDSQESKEENELEIEEPAPDDSIKRYADKNPELAAELIKAWMKEK